MAEINKKIDHEHPPVIVAGGVIEQDGKYLLVQEAKDGCAGQWNLPAGRLDPGETILDGSPTRKFSA